MFGDMSDKIEVKLTFITILAHAEVSNSCIHLFQLTM